MTSLDSPFNFDVEALIAESDRHASKRVKREWLKKGYSYQMSLYGAVYNEDEDKFTARRIEILSDYPWIPRTLKAVADGFNEYMPHFRYSIWAFSHSALNLKLIGGYD